MAHNPQQPSIASLFSNMTTHFTRAGLHIAIYKYHFDLYHLGLISSDVWETGTTCTYPMINTTDTQILHDQLTTAVEAGAERPEPPYTKAHYLMLAAAINVVFPQADESDFNTMLKTHEKLIQMVCEERDQRGLGLGLKTT